MTWANLYRYRLVNTVLIITLDWQGWTWLH
jgi:hypothetical protein